MPDGTDEWVNLENTFEEAADDASDGADAAVAHNGTEVDAKISALDAHILHLKAIRARMQ